MVRDELYVGKLLCKDAAKIVIDEEFKYDLKNRIIHGESYNKITELPKHKNSFIQNKYFKIASGFIICVFVSGSIFKAIELPSKSIFTKGEGTPDMIIPVGAKNLPKNNSGNTSVLQPKDLKSKSITDIKQSKGNTADNKNTGNVNSIESATDINKSLVKDNKNAIISTEVTDPINVPKKENVKEVAIGSLESYDSRYSLDEKVLLSVKDDGIYIQNVESLKEEKLVSYNVNTQIINKPNFLSNDSIIYYKAEKITLENGDSGEKGAIYLADENGQETTKVVDGKAPMVSKDGKKLVYETEGKICILTLATNNKKFVDNGKYPAFSDDGNTISYVKQTQNYDVSTGNEDVYIQKSVSGLYVYDLVTEEIRRLTDKGVIINDASIESWAGSVREGNVISDFNVTTKYSYYDSIWSSNNQEIYVIRANNETKSFELIKFSLNN